MPSKPRHSDTVNHGQESTHFGFQTVSRKEKTAGVRAVFESAAPNYDRMNDVMSLTLHRFWKNLFIENLARAGIVRLLDLAGGTGDIAFGFEHISRRHKNISVCDPSPAMLKRAQSRPRAERIEWICGEAENLPLARHSFDGCSLAFGLRNFTDTARALGQIGNVLTPGGWLMILELGHVDMPVLRRLYDFYCLSLIPKLGAAISGQGAAYRYLAESIRAFPDKYQIIDQITKAGFTDVECDDLSMGIVNFYRARKAPS